MHVNKAQNIYTCICDVAKSAHFTISQPIKKGTLEKKNSKKNCYWDTHTGYKLYIVIQDYA